ncbi:hypothetical protein GCM10012275_09730 [Longimycelium tulufanense]|uniref:Peptidase S33 tripeptidyl aminopeptidase-like C-terminal domain-containing protein n=1 Tax=Longimycelium tulufanense TaxID=907463 RepID=A0A8J3FV42_9PSEU|nr:alpha/beta hydrolase [Longimycelium tulufanense]GGM40832.1 hypothetical protein GCM10012275_09730 [Longimycelium tulufanense]
MFAQVGKPRDREAEITWRVEEFWRLLNGPVLPFDAEWFRRFEERLIDHTGRLDFPTTHNLIFPTGLDRATELANVSTPTLVIDTPEDPVNPPPHARHLACLIPTARLVTIPGMGHALSPAIFSPLTEAILTHTTTVDRH